MGMQIRDRKRAHDGGTDSKKDSRRDRLKCGGRDRLRRREKEKVVEA